MAASYPGAIKTFSAVVNGVTKLVATLFNSPYEEITAIQTELGTDVAGSAADLKTRLAVSIGAGGALIGNQAIKAWINFYGGTDPVAINDSYNVASIADDGTGSYTITWDVDFANTFYACVAISNMSQTYCPKSGQGLVAGTAGVSTQDSAGTPTDASVVSVIAIGDQA